MISIKVVIQLRRPPEPRRPPENRSFLLPQHQSIIPLKLFQKLLDLYFLVGFTFESALVLRELKD